MRTEHFFTLDYRTLLQQLHRDRHERVKSLWTEGKSLLVLLDKLIKSTDVDDQDRKEALLSAGGVDELRQQLMKSNNELQRVSRQRNIHEINSGELGDLLLETTDLHIKARKVILPTPEVRRVILPERRRRKTNDDDEKAEKEDDDDNLSMELSRSQKKMDRHIQEIDRLTSELRDAKMNADRCRQEQESHRASMSALREESDEQRQRLEAATIEAAEAKTKWSQVRSDALASETELKALKSARKEANTSLQTKLSSVEKDLNKLQGRMSSQASKLLRQQSQISELETERDRLVSQVKSLSEEHSVARETLAAQLTSQESRLLQRIRDLETDVKEKQNALSDRTRKVQDLESRLIENKGSRSSLESRITAMESQLTDQESRMLLEINAAKAELTALKSSSSIKLKECHDVQDELKRQQELVAAGLKEKIKALNEKMRKITPTASDKTRITELESELEEYKASHERILTTANINTPEHLARDKRMAESENKFRVQWAAKQLLAARRKVKLDDCVSRAHRLEQQLTKTQREHVELGSSHALLTSTLTDRNAAIVRLRAVIDQKTTELSEYMVTHNVLTETYDTLKNEDDQCRLTLKETQATLDRQTRAWVIKEEEWKKHVAEIQSSTNISTVELEEKLQTLLSEKQELETTLQTLQENNEAVAEEHTRLVVSLEEQLGEQNRLLLTSTKGHKEALLAVTRCEESLKKEKSDANTLVSTQVQLTEVQLELKNRMKTMSELKRSLDELSKENEKLTNNIDSKTREISELSQQNETSADDLRKKAEELTKAIERHDLVKSKYDIIVKEYNDQKITLTETSVQLEEAQTALTANILENGDKLKKLTEERDEARKRSNKYLKSIKETHVPKIKLLTNELEHMKTSLKETNTTLEETQKTLISRVSQLTTCQKDLADAKRTEGRVPVIDDMTANETLVDNLLNDPRNTPLVGESKPWYGQLLRYIIKLNRQKFPDNVQIALPVLTPQDVMYVFGLRDAGDMNVVEDDQIRRNIARYDAEITLANPWVEGDRNQVRKNIVKMYSEKVTTDDRVFEQMFRTLLTLRKLVAPRSRLTKQTKKTILGNIFGQLVIPTIKKT
jgi:chromosome segregation ATPase